MEVFSLTPEQSRLKFGIANSEMRDIMRTPLIARLIARAQLELENIGLIPPLDEARSPFHATRAGKTPGLSP